MKILTADACNIYKNIQCKTIYKTISYYFYVAK